MKAHCPNCSKIVEGVHPVGGKLASAALVGLLGGGATKSVGGAIVGAALGLAIGHLIDTEVAPRCPLCATLLRVAIATA